MNIKRLLFWIGFLVVLALIIWGLVVSMNRPNQFNGKTGTPSPVTADDHIYGLATAPITIIEYSDFQCPACASYQPVVKKLMSEMVGRARLVYRHFPLDNVLPNGQVQHPNAVPAARAAEAAAKQGKFWEMHDQLFENQNDWAELKDPKTIFGIYAAKIGLDMKKYEADYNSKEIIDRVQAEKNEGIKIDINHTPTFFVNGKEINNPNSYEEFKKLVEAAATAGSR